MMSEQLETVDVDVFSPENFPKYFREVGKSKPEKGESLVIFRSPAELVDGDVKKDVIDHMTTSNFGAQHGIQVLMRNCSMSYADAMRVCKEICSDMITLDREHVLSKPYKFVFEKMYYANKKHVPEDPRWEIVNLKLANAKEQVVEEYN
jgi:hypothetical protein